MSMAIDNNRKKNVAVFPNVLKKITIVLNRFLRNNSRYILIHNY